jgi:hypothetical protein
MFLETKVKNDLRFFPVPTSQDSLSVPHQTDDRETSDVYDRVEVKKYYSLRILCWNVACHKVGKNIMVFVIVFGIALVFVFIKTKNKIDFLETREESAKIKAQVVEYRLEKEEQMRNDYVTRNYSYVKILTKGPDYGKVRRLRYDNIISIWPWPLKISHTIDVFWYAGELFYWDAMDRGIEGYLPDRWPWK